MKRRISIVTLLLFVVLAVLTIVARTRSAQSQGANPNSGGEIIDRSTLAKFFSPLEPVAKSAKYELTDALTDLGRALYYERRLSIGQQISCNSCHILSKYGVDGLPASPGHEGKLGTRNSPTVYNAAFHIAQFWDGRSPDVEDQALGPVTNPIEMAMPDRAYVDKVLRSIPGYESMFRAAFPNEKQPVSFANGARAIGAFERRLVTPGRFDKLLEGDNGALNAQEQRGLKTFIEVNCTMCHSGALLGGQMFTRMGLVKAYPTKDLGRYEVTKKEADKYVFKVPSLRDIAETGPYLHDGSVASLEQVVRIMGEYQLGNNLTEQQVTDIVAFLRSLTGKIPSDYIKEPQLPASGPKTPRAGK